MDYGYMREDSKIVEFSWMKRNNYTVSRILLLSFRTMQ